jgi:hypothetical protein
LLAESIARIPIRRISVVVNPNDPLSAGLTLAEFMETYGASPDPALYRIINIELITSPDDQQPMLVSECGRYGRFIKREGNEVIFRKEAQT